MTRTHVESCARITKNTHYYFRKPVWEFSLPAGHTCPLAVECRVSVDESTGKFTNESGAFRCYAASAERFPAVRKRRWDNLRAVSAGQMPEIHPSVTHVRIHSSGDFFRQDYFDRWLDIARSRQGVLFWAFTKSLPFWVSRLHDIPNNLILTASFGGRRDDLIAEHGLKCARVYRSAEDVPEGMPIDTDDRYAAMPFVSFALLDNNA